jgi:hypothetical protein
MPQIRGAQASARYAIHAYVAQNDPPHRILTKLSREVGLPIGVEDGASYRTTTVAAPPAATFPTFTDGLVERRGESLDRELQLT